MANGWTQERRKRQAAIIHAWNPSGQSTGPRTADGKARSSLNALKHGARSKCTSAITTAFKKILAAHFEIQAQVSKKLV